VSFFAPPPGGGLVLGTIQERVPFRRQHKSHLSLACTPGTGGPVGFANLLCKVQNRAQSEPDETHVLSDSLTLSTRTFGLIVST
jgi:hypothetical protein